MPNNHIKELQSINKTSSAAITSTPCRVHGLYVVGAATAGSVILKNGGSGGTTKLTINTPPITTSGTTFAIYIPIPGDGLWFTTDCYATITTAASVEVLFSPESVM